MVTTSYCRHCGADAAGSGRFCTSCGYVLTPSGEQAVDRLLLRLRDATVGEYDVVRQLGRGGMAAVYLAWDLDLARYVAIKVMFPELELQDGMAQRFLREARLAASLDDHPNVVRVYRARDIDGMRFFAMKYIDGCSLEQLLRAVGPLPIGIVCHVLDQVARALQYAHGRGIVHRDVKPSNVMLDRSGSAIVTDFGIARAAEGEQLTRTGFAIGTPAYMSPEQWRGEEFSAASDQYALGAVAYQMLAGTLPHGGTPYEMQEGHIRHGPTPLREVRGDCPPMLASAVHRMLAKRPQDRWPDLTTVSTLLLDLAGAPSAQLAAELSALVPMAMPASVAGESVTPRSPVVPARVVATQPAADVSPPPGSTPRTPIPTATAAPPDATRDVVPNTVADVASIVSRDATPATSAPAVAASAVAASAVAPSLADTAYTPRPTGSTATTPTGEVRRTPMGLPQISTTETHTAFALPVANPRRRRWTLVVGGLALAGAITFALILDRSTNPVAAAPAGAAPSADSGSRKVAAAGEPTKAAQEPTPAPVDSGAGHAAVAAPRDSVVPDTAVGPPARIEIVPSSRQIALGDSIQVSARVFDAKNKRIASALVDVQPSTDTAEIAWRVHGARRYAVARKPGGRLTIVARSGGLTRPVTLSVGPARIAAASPSPGPAPSTGNAPTPFAAAPSDAELVPAVEDFLGLLRSGRLSQIAAPDGDAESSQAFLDWLGKSKGIHADVVGAPHDIAAAGQRDAVAEYSVQLSRSGTFKRTTISPPTKFGLTFVRENGAWHFGHAKLLERFTPK